MSTIHDDNQTMRGGLGVRVRSVAQNGALTIADTDGLVLLDSADTATKAATMTATFEGHRIEVLLATYASTGKYTLAVKRGAASLTVTLDAAGEGCTIVYDGSSWQLVDLLGGATAA